MKRVCDCLEILLRFICFMSESQFLPESVQLSRSVRSDSLRPHDSQQARPPCPSPTSRVYSSSCPLSQWCHPTISSSVTVSVRLQSFLASGTFPRSQFFALGGQSIGVSASASVLAMNIQDWSPLGWTGWISFRMDWLDLLAVQGTLKSLLQHHSPLGHEELGQLKWFNTAHNLCQVLEIHSPVCLRPQPWAN